MNKEDREWLEQLIKENRGDFIVEQRKKIEDELVDNIEDDVVLSGVLNHMDMVNITIDTQLKTIKLLKQENDQLKEELKDEEEQRIKIAKDREQTYKECLSLIEQKKELRSWLEEELKDCDNYSKYIENKLQEVKTRSSGKTYIANEIMKMKLLKNALKIY